MLVYQNNYDYQYFKILNLYYKYKLLIVRMETEPETKIFQNLLENLETKIKQVGHLRTLINSELLSAQSLFENKNKLMQKLKTTQEDLDGLKYKVCTEIRRQIQTGLEQLKHGCQEMIDNIKIQYESIIEETKSKYSRQVCERDNELQKQHLIIRSLREELALTKLKMESASIQNNGIKIQMKPQGKSSQSFFKPHRFSVDLDFRTKNQQQKTPLKFIKTSFNSPQVFEEMSLSKQQLLDISPSSIKRQSESLFSELDINSKRKQFLQSIPFDAQQSIVESNVQIKQNVFAKLTFGKEKAKDLKSSPIRNDSVLKPLPRNQPLVKHLKSQYSGKPPQEYLLKQIKNVFEPTKRLSMNMQIGNYKKSNQNQQYLNNEDKKLFQEKKYVQLIKNQFGKENAYSKKIKTAGLYVGDSQKEVKYEGFRKNGKKHGKGILYYSDGLVYDGQFSNNMRHGFGVLRLDHVSIYSGNWQNDTISGDGRLKNCPIINQNTKSSSRGSTFQKWLSYKGNFKNNMFCGSGELQLPNGQKFIGEFVDGKIQGEGIYFRNQQQCTFGIWKNNKLVQEK